MNQKWTFSKWQKKKSLDVLSLVFTTAFKSCFHFSRIIIFNVINWHTNYPEESVYPLTKVRSWFKGDCHLHSNLKQERDSIFPAIVCFPEEKEFSIKSKQHGQRPSIWWLQMREMVKQNRNRSGVEIIFWSAYRNQTV